jgi:hypothetical protein
VYREALNRVESPIVTTFSRKDRPLRIGFHVAVQASRLGNWGRPQPELKLSSASLLVESKIKLPNDTPPDKFYSALGGYPPTTLFAEEFRIVDPVEVGEPYDFGEPAVRVRAMRMHEKILDHGKIKNNDTYYLLHTLVER